MGTMVSACPSELRSEIRPMSTGEGTSPKMWMTKMCSATAVARSVGATTLTMAELMGPVEANIRTSAATMHGRYTDGEGAVSASQASGQASRVATPEM